MPTGAVSPGARSPAGRAAPPSPTGRRRSPGALWWAPVGLAVVYGLVVLGHFRGITASFYTNSDYAMAPVIAGALGGGHAGSQVLIGDYRWYEPLTFLRATRWLPLHRQLWDLTPLACDLCGLGLLAATARRVFGLWPALLAAAALLCVGQDGLQTFLTFNSHGATAVHAIVLCAALVWLASREGFVGWPRLVGGSLVLGVLSAAAVPDQLFLVWGLGPFVAAAALIGWRETGPASKRLLAFAVATSGVALLGGHAYEAIMRHDGIGTTVFPLTFTPASMLGGHITMALEGFTLLAGGDFFGLPLTFANLTVFVAGGLVLAALLVTLVEVRRRIVAAAPRAAGGSPAVTARLAYVAFWSTCLIATLISFTFVSAEGNADGSRYLLGGYVALAALIPILAERSLGFRLSLAGGVAALAVIATYQLQRASVNPQGRSPSTSEAGALSRFAASHGLKYGYAGYWDSLPFTWETDFRVEVFPVAQCAAGALTLCPFSSVHVSSWYVPRADTPTFLIVDPTEPFVSAPDPALGKPVLSAAIDDLRVYVYSYDIASRLGTGYAP